MFNTENKNVVFLKAMIGVCFLFCITLLLLFLLNRTPEAEDPSPQNKEVITYRGPYITVYEYDSCEYIESKQGITHKGNCKYCAARANKK